MLYIIRYSYTPHTAVSNRLLGYFKALDDLGVKATVFIIMSTKKQCEIGDNFKHLKIIYMFDHMLIKHRLIFPLYFIWATYRIRKMLKPGDVVYTYRYDRLTQMCLGVPGVKYYAEITEHPDVTPLPESRLIGISKERMISGVKKLSGIFVISKALRNYFIDLGLEASRVHIINMTVDSSRFIGLSKQQTQERYIAYCGTASNNKDGVDELIKAFALVAAKITDIYLYIIGNTPTEDDKSGNLALIDNLRLNDRIKFLGLVHSSEMPQLLKNAEVLVLNRPDNLQARHGFPTKLGEYLLTENPVVVTAVGDIPLFLKDGVSALLSSPCDPECFANKVIWALEHPLEAAKIGINGSLVAIREFNSRIETKKMLEIVYN